MLSNVWCAPNRIEYEIFKVDLVVKGEGKKREVVDSNFASNKNLKI